MEIGIGLIRQERVHRVYWENREHVTYFRAKFHSKQILCIGEYGLQNRQQVLVLLRELFLLFCSSLFALPFLSILLPL